MIPTFPPVTMGNINSPEPRRVHNDKIATNGVIALILENYIHILLAKNVSVDLLLLTNIPIANMLVNTR